MAYDYVQPKRLQNLQRMRLYSNQTKDKSLVGDTTLFAVFNTVLSNLYNDKLGVEFAPGHPDDTYKIEALRPIWKYDSYKFNKEQFDYDYDWYTAFWGAGFLDVTTWDTKRKLMLPSVIDNATFLIDPDCTLINGDARGFGKARFWGREISKTKSDMRDEKNYEGFEKLSAGQDYSSLIYQDQQYRRSAQNLAQEAKPVDYVNENIPLIEWWTTVDGERWLFTVDTQFKNIVRSQKWWHKDWPLCHRKLFPIPGDPFGVSIPDLIEDKQRARSVLTNLGLMHAKSDLYPMHIYDRNAISPTSDLSFGFNKWIPVDGNPSEAVKMLDKQPIGQIVSYIMDVIDQAAQKATAATSMQQGVQAEKPRSANEVVRTFNASDERLTTSARVFGWSERELVTWWLRNYNKYFTAAHEKFVRIDGPFGPKFKKVKGDNFQFEDDPDIYIDSKTVSEARNQERQQQLVAFGNLTQQDQSLNRRYFNKKAAKIVGGFEADEVDRLYPPTADELKAQGENDQLNDNKVPKIDIHDDHYIHLQIHANADDTHASIVHIEAHKKAIMILRQMQLAQQGTNSQPGAQPTTVQTTPNQQGQGSAPAAQSAPTQSVQQ